MSELETPSTTTSSDDALIVDSVTIVHGGDEPVRAAVLDQHGNVTALVMVPRNWAEQDTSVRYRPEGDLLLLCDDETAPPVVGSRRVAGVWVAPVLPAPLSAAPDSVSDLVGLVEALRALTPAQAAELQQLLTAPSATT